VNRNDLAAREAAISEVMGQCGVKDPKVAVVIVMAAAQRVLLAGDEETSLALRALSALLDRLSALRGQRAIVLASPSFLISDHEHREYEVVDRAVRSHVVISTLDTRGVYTDENDIFDSNVLSEFADATGGIFFHNNNDLNEGLRRAVSAPEYVYELGFSPNDLKEDGKFHHLKVKPTRASSLAPEKATSRPLTCSI
jgi:VWFA-related protein